MKIQFLGYSGEFCEIELNECDPNPCFNSAQCIDLMGSFTCICDLAYTGFLCEIQIDFCEENPCLNGGSCSGIVKYLTPFVIEKWPGYLTISISRFKTKIINASF